jgi:hypothetical protein
LRVCAWHPISGWFIELHQASGEARVDFGTGFDEHLFHRHATVHGLVEGISTVGIDCVDRQWGNRLFSHLLRLAAPGAGNRTLMNFVNQLGNLPAISYRMFLDQRDG